MKDFLTPYALGILAIYGGAPEGHEFYGNQWELRKDMWPKEKGQKEPVEMVSIEKLSSNPNEVWSDRYRNDPETVARLSRMSKHMVSGGKTMALSVRKGVGNNYVVIDGQHRLNAARQAGITHVGVQDLTHLLHKDT